MADIDPRFTLHSTTDDRAKKSWQTMTRMKRQMEGTTTVLRILFAGDDFEKKVSRMAGLADAGTVVKVVFEKDVPDVDAQDLERAQAALQKLGFTGHPDGSWTKTM
jgi:glycosyltransferase A (GT-A) superfamily protein (DUF2064 family)